ncbi:unnamed protein product, partial [Choristocarpus tenellus]
MTFNIDRRQLETHLSWTSQDKEGSVPCLLSLLSISLYSNENRVRDVGVRGHLSPRASGREDVRALAGASRFQIKRLSRVYNILIFGGPSQAELLEEAELESGGPLLPNSFTECGVGRDDETCFVLGSVAGVAFELRQSRRFDTANALEGLVEYLLPDDRTNNDLCRTSARMLMLLLRLSGSGLDNEVDDHRLIGRHGQGVLQAIRWKGKDRQGRGEREAVNGAMDVVDNACLTWGGNRFGNNLWQWSNEDSHRFSNVNECDLSQLKGGASTKNSVLPKDCDVFGNSPTVGGGFDSSRREQVAWFSNTDCLLEKRFSSLTRQDAPPELRQQMAAMAAPLSLDSWTQPFGNISPPSVLHSASSDPASSSDPTGGPDFSVAFCGALRQGWIDESSDSYRELRVKLSIPNIGSTPVNFLNLTSDSSVNAIDRFGTPLLLGPNTTSGQTCLPECRAFHPTKNNSKMEDAEVVEDAAAIQLLPTGWERAEALRDHSALPRWALAPSPLVTCEGPAAFEACFREHYSETTGTAGAPTVTMDVVARRALAAIQGMPSDSFIFHEGRAAVLPIGIGLGVGTDLRVAGLSPGALASALTEFAEAGTWFHRVEAFSNFLVANPTVVGKVSGAFGSELRRQIALLQGRLLTVAAQMGDDVGEDGSDGCGGHKRNTVDPGSLTLPNLLVRTRLLRQVARALAELCGVTAEDLGATAGGVEGACKSFPCGAALLSYLFREAVAQEVTASSILSPFTLEDGKTGAGAWEWYRWAVLCLLRSAASPYLSMLSKWIWSGDLKQTDDPYMEFPLSCEDETGLDIAGLGGGRGGHDAPWMVGG